jgi:hypothetical protein
MGVPVVLSLCGPVEPGRRRKCRAGRRHKARRSRREGTVWEKAAGLADEQLQDVVNDVASAGTALGQVNLVEEAERFACKRKEEIDEMK